MATPIQYTPQYIPTDVGMMGDVLGKRQAEYEAGYAAPLMFEDQFAQIPVSPENIAGKQAVLGNFQERIKNIVDQYGGDYGAASRDIVREIARERQNPFYQLAPQHAQALKRQQALIDKYGAMAWSLDEVPKQFVTPEGQIQDINLDPRIVNQRDIEQSLMSELGYLKGQTETGDPKISKTMPGYYEMDVTKGVTEAQREDIEQRMLQRIYDMDPDLAAAIDAGDPRAMQIASNMTRQMMLGTQKSFKPIPGYGKQPESQFPSAIPYTTTGVVPGDTGDVSREILEESIKSKAGKAEWLFGKTGERKSPRAYIGTSSFGATTNPLERMFGSVVIQNTPELQAMQTAPVMSSDLSTKDQQNLVAKNLNIDNDIKSIIQSAENEYATVSQRLGELKGIKKTLAGKADFEKVLFTKLVEYTDGDTDLANSIADAYNSNQSTWEKTYNDEMNQLVNSDAFNKSNQFGFTTIDAMSKSGKSSLDRLMGMSKTLLTPDRIEFLTGNLKDEDKKDKVEAYKSEKSSPEIVGIGGDDQNGVLFIVKQPDGEQALATLDVADEFVANVAFSMGRPDLITAPMYKTAFESISKQEQSIGEDLYSKKLNDGTAILYYKEDGRELPITNQVIQDLSLQMQERGAPGIPVPETGNPDTPYRFRSPAVYFSLIRYLSDTQ